MLAEAVRRGRAYLEAGAPVVFVPGVVAREEIEALVEGLGRGTISLISAPGRSLPARELQELGVARVSTGPYTQHVALTALQDAAAEIAAGGMLPPGTRRMNSATVTPRGEARAPRSAQARAPVCRSPGQVTVGAACPPSSSSSRSTRGERGVGFVRARRRGHRRDP
jgi:hypothetical protein